MAAVTRAKARRGKGDRPDNVIDLTLDTSDGDPTPLSRTNTNAVNSAPRTRRLRSRKDHEDARRRKAVVVDSDSDFEEPKSMTRRTPISVADRIPVPIEIPTPRFRDRHRQCKTEDASPRGGGEKNENDFKDGSSGVRTLVVHGTIPYTTYDRLRLMNASSWINDEIVDAFCHCLARRYSPMVTALSSHFFMTLHRSHGSGSKNAQSLTANSPIMKWTRREDYWYKGSGLARQRQQKNDGSESSRPRESPKVVLIPVVWRGHWTLVAINLGLSRIEYFDSMVRSPVILPFRFDRDRMETPDKDAARPGARVRGIGESGLLLIRSWLWTDWVIKTEQMRANDTMSDELGRESYDRNSRSFTSPPPPPPPPPLLPPPLPATSTSTQSLPTSGTIDLHRTCPTVESEDAFDSNPISEQTLWKDTATRTPNQLDGSSCGAFACRFAHYVAATVATKVRHLAPVSPICRDAVSQEPSLLNGISFAQNDVETFRINMDAVLRSARKIDAL